MVTESKKTAKNVMKVSKRIGNVAMPNASSYTAPHVVIPMLSVVMSARLQVRGGPQNTTNL